MKKIRICAIVGMMVLLSTATAFADVFSAATSLIADAQSFILTVSTPCAIIGVGTGALMKKFSLGDMEKIKMGGKIISGSIMAWALLNGLTLILDTINNYI